MNSKRGKPVLVIITKTLSGGKLDEPRTELKYIPPRGFGNPEPRHFDATWAGWKPGKNSKGKPCKVWVKDRRPEYARPE